MVRLPCTCVSCLPHTRCACQAQLSLHWNCCATHPACLDVVLWLATWLWSFLSDKPHRCTWGRMAAFGADFGRYAVAVCLIYLIMR